MSDTVYRFLPWARQGLAAAIPAATGALPARTSVDVEVVIAGAGTATPKATLFGPGDVIGLDPSSIVRTTPRANASNVEPNYLAAIDFDAPDLPWLFTPGAPAANGRLQPWVVLVVVERRPGVTITVPAGAPLPQLTIESGAAAEVGDLADSWAWAHAQVLRDESAPDLAADLRDHPERNVSRLVCPRRLAADKRWYACLVPAFDAGVARGLGQKPGTGPLGPAWSNPEHLTLPLYFHWEFGTGPAGDFESLARRIKPVKAAVTVGTVRMHIGAASPVVKLPEGDPQRIVDMDGALRAPILTDGTLDQIAAPIRDGLQAVASILADAADGRIDGVANTTPGEQPLGPPTYASFHANRQLVTDDTPPWFRELNLDPRSRVAAGLGAEVVRVNQEDFVHAAWQQVGTVLEAMAVLSRARLSLEAARRFHERHIVPLEADRVLQLTGPLATRTRFGDGSVRSAVAATSMPDAVIDPAMRRFTAPTSRIVAKTARRLGMARGTASMLHTVDRLAAGDTAIDATRFPQPAIDGVAVTELPDAEDGLVDLRPLGLALTVAAADGKAMLAASKALTTTDAPPVAELTALRPDLPTVGILTDSHVRAARTLVHAAAAEGHGIAVNDVLSSVMKRAGTSAGAGGFLVGRTRRGALEVDALDLTGAGALTVRTAPHLDNIVVANVETSLARNGPSIISRIPPGALSASGRHPIALRPGLHPGAVEIDTPVLATTPAANPATTPIDTPVNTVTIAALQTDSAVLSRFSDAAREVLATTVLGVGEPTLQLVPFALADAATALRQRCDPTVAQPARLDAMVAFAGTPVSQIAAVRDRVNGWAVAPTADRVMAYPQIGATLFQHLARFDRTRFVPGIDTIPTDSITVLETNQRFIAGFLAGVNHEMNRELLWRSYPTDRRGTPFRRFWGRLDGKLDIPEMHLWGNGLLAAQTTDGKAKIVLLVRGELLRRYPNTVVVAIKAVDDRTPSTVPPETLHPIFAGQFDPDVTFYGFDLEDHDLTDGTGYFFALMEPITEPRFGFDETVDTTRGATPGTWNDAAWPDLTGIAAGGQLNAGALASLAASAHLPAVNQAHGVAAALFQQPFELLVHAKHLVEVV